MCFAVIDVSFQFEQAIVTTGENKSAEICLQVVSGILGRAVSFGVIPSADSDPRTLNGNCMCLMFCVIL